MKILPETQFHLGFTDMLVYQSQIIAAIQIRPDGRRCRMVWRLFILFQGIPQNFLRQTPGMATITAPTVTTLNTLWMHECEFH